MIFIIFWVSIVISLHILRNNNCNYRKLINDQHAVHVKHLSVEFVLIAFLNLMKCTLEYLAAGQSPLPLAV